jgi:hypothetical protein
LEFVLVGAFNIVKNEALKNYGIGYNQNYLGLTVGAFSTGRL